MVAGAGESGHATADGRRTGTRRRRRVGVAGGLVVLAGLLLSPTGCYLSRAAWEEARILQRRRPIAEAAADPALPAAMRAKLALVVEARRFAVEELGLRAEGAFTRFSRLDRDTLVLVLSAAHRDRLERRTWWFPVVGRFPYKGFFDFGAARRTAEAMRRDGFDVRLGASSAFSTLGWFEDPVVSPTLRLDSVALVNTVIHELTHTTFFAGGRVVFNESFASFVGGRGAVAFFAARGDSVRAADARRRWREERLLGAFWAGLYAALDSAFAAHPDTGPDVRRAAARFRRLAARDALYARARRTLADSIAPRLAGADAGWARRVPLDNAVLLARRVYATDLDTFDAVLAAKDGDLRAAFAAITAAARDADDPFAVVRALAGR